MINYDSFLLKLTTDEIISFADNISIIASLSRLAKEAIEAEKTVNEKYKFEDGQEKIVIWNDGYNEESITSDKVWHADYINNQYNVKCTAEGIYDVYRAQFIYDNSCIREDDIVKKAKTAANFREFVKHIRIIK